MATAFPYLWMWDRCSGCVRKRLARKAGALCPVDCPGLRPGSGRHAGKRCRVLARGKMNSARIEFEDGSTMIASRNGLRRAGR